MSCAAELTRTPEGQVPWPWTKGNIIATFLPTTATKHVDGEDTDWSIPPPPPHSNPRPPKSRSAQQQSQPRPERPRDGAVPDLTLPEDRTIGNGHRSSAISFSAKVSKGGDTGTRATYLDLISGPFFIEAYSGSGRMAAGVRRQGVEAFEFDITVQGGRRNLLHANVLHELKALIAHPMCQGIWFGFPCGTFSSARRYDGGPRPLRTFGSCLLLWARSEHGYNQPTSYFFELMS